MGEEELTIPAPTHWCPNCDRVFHQPFRCAACGVDARSIGERVVVSREDSVIAGILNQAIDREGRDALAAQATREKISSLREVHLRMYGNRLRGSRQGVNEMETQRLYDLWLGMAGKAFDELEVGQQLEVLDALAED